MSNKKKIALVTMAKDEDLYLQEWIDYNLKLGFDDIYIYQNNWRFENQKQDERVHFMEWDVASTEPKPGQKTWEWNRHAQCYSHFGKEFHKEYEWAAFYDVDCFLALKKWDNVKDFISDYDNIKQCQLVINFAWFGDSGIKEFDENYTSVLERFTKRWGRAYNHSYYQFAPICKLHENFGCHSLHFVEGQWIDIDGQVGVGLSGKNRRISFDKAQINHYYTKTLPEWKMKMKKTRAEGDWMKNRIETFHQNNFSDIEDLHALNFFKNK
jgi:hypothetical protein